MDKRSVPKYSGSLISGFLCLLVVILFIGCAMRSDFTAGQSSLAKGNYDGAISQFQYALKKSPNDPKILSELGYAYFKKDDLQNAIQYLEQAKAIDPKYDKPYIYLGIIYEKQDNIPKAVQEYNAYYKQWPLSPLGFKLKARIGVLMRNQITKEVQAMIQQEKSLQVDSIPENTIAVSYFTNQTGNAEYDPLAKGLVDLIITDLTKAKSLTVLERTKLQVLMDELKLNSTAAVDTTTSQRFGKLLGARRIVSGGIASPQEKMLRIDAISVNVATDKADAQADVSDNQDKFFMMEKDIVFGILDELKVSLTQEERDSIQKLPTESFLAFLAYSRGLDLEDRGMYREAAGEFQKASQIDPGFTQAKDKQQVSQTLSETPMTGASGETAQFEQAVSQAEVPSAEEAFLTSGDRLQPIGRNSSEGFFPDAGSKADYERTQPQIQNTAIMNLIIEW